MEEPTLKILIVEDSPTDRLILQSIVTQAGHQAIPVADGQAAIFAYEEQAPDIVLLDVIMPGMHGHEVAQVLREKAAKEDDLVPIIFLTSLTDTDSLVKCIEAGGIDFIPKPYNKVVLSAKIRAFARMREMNRTLLGQKKQIELHNQHMIQEQTVAKQVFDQITHSGCLDEGYLRYYMSPLAVFNGDVMVADVSPTGSLCVLLGDFTGHGLPAAIGSMPLATTFYGMVRKGFSISDIIREINKKLHEILPVGFFCCATILDINVEQKRLRYWNGGLPPSMLYRACENEFEVISSRNLPLGVLANNTFNSETVRVPLEFGDKILMWSDGIFEARNERGDMYGEERLHALMEMHKGSDELFRIMLDRVHEYIGETEKDDDISLIEVPFLDRVYESKFAESDKRGKEALADWAMDFTIKASSLRQFDPLPTVTGILNEVSGLSPHRSTIYTIVAELYSNALDHGVLGLDSKLKQTPAGFGEYYELRKNRLSALDEGEIQFSFLHTQSYDEQGALSGRLSIRLQDSGPGFGVEKDVRFIKQTENELNQNPLENQYFGRGLTLVKAVCESVFIRAPGNDVEVHFVWHEHDR